MRRRLNVKFLGCLLAVLAVAAVGVHFLHGFQVRRHADVYLGLADRAEKDQDTAKALDHLGRYLAYKPQDVEVLIRYGKLMDQIAVKTRNPRLRDRAFGVLAKALLSDPNRPDVQRRLVEICLDLGRYPQARGKASEARDYIKSLREAKGGKEDGELDLYEATSYELSANFQEAGRLYLAAIRHTLKDPEKRVEAYSRLAYLLRRHLPDAGKVEPGEFRKALGLPPDRANPGGLSRNLLNYPIPPGDEVINRLVATNPGDFRAYLARAQYREDFFRDARGAELAAEDVATAHKLKPKDPGVLLKSALVALKKKDYDGARDLLKAGIKRSAGDPATLAALYKARTVTERLDGKREQEIAVFGEGLKALGSAPEALELRFRLAEALIQTGKDREARAEMARLKAEKFPAAPLDLLEALALVQHQEWAKAAPILEDLQARLAGFSDLKDRPGPLLVLCYEQLGDYDHKLETCRRAVAADPASAQARLQLGLALMDRVSNGHSAAEVRDAQDAVSEFRRMMALPEHPLGGWKLLARALLNLRGVMKLAPDQGGWADVEDALERAKQAEPGSLEVVFLEAEIYAARKEMGRARDLLEKARRAQPEQLDVWLALANLNRADGKPQEELHVLEEARKELRDSLTLRLARARHWMRVGGTEAKRALARMTDDLKGLTPDEQDRLLTYVGAAYLVLGDTKEAGRLWNRVAGTERQKKNLAIRQRLLDLALQTKDQAALRRLVGEVRAVEGEDGWQWRYGQAMLLFLQGKDKKELLGEAQKYLEQVARRRRNWPRVPVLEGMIADQQGEPEKAAALLRKAFDLGERDPQVVRRLVWLLDRLNNQAEAAEVLQRVPEQTFLTDNFGHLAVELALRQKNTDRAVDWARQVVPEGSVKYEDHLWKGRVLEAANQPEEAEKSFRKALRLGPNVPDVWVALVRHLAGKGQAKEAAGVFAEARGKIGQDPLALARCYEALGRDDDAERYFKKALAAKPGDRAAQFSLANFYFRLHKLDQAEPLLAALGEGKAREAGTAQANRYLAVSLASKGKVEEALSVLARNFDRRGKGGTLEDRRLKGILLVRLPNRVAEAIEVFKELADRAGADPQDRFALARLYVADKNWRQAETQMRTLLKVQGQNPDYLAFFVELLLGRGDLKGAEVWLKRLESVRPDWFQTVRLKASIYKAFQAQAESQGKKVPDDRDPARVVRDFAANAREDDLRAAAGLMESLGRFEDAEELYRRYRKESKKPESKLVLAEYLGRRAVEEKDRARLEKALDLCDRAWADCPAEKVALTSTFLITHSKALNGKEPDPVLCRRVEERIRAALKKSRSTRLLLSLANSYALRQAYAEAVPCYRQVVQEDPRNVLALNNLAWMLAKTSPRRDDREQALQVVQRAINIAGPLAALLDTRAFVYRKLGKTWAAVADLREVTGDRRYTKPEGFFHLALVELQEGHDGAAKQAWQKAQKLKLSRAELDPDEQKDYEQLAKKFGG